MLARAVKAQPKSGRAVALLGVARYQDSYGEKGAREIKRGVKMAPEDPVVARALVLLWLEQDKPAKALKVAKRFAKVRKDHAMGPFLMGLVQEQQEEFKPAIASYEKAIKLDDRFIDAHKNLAILCIAQNLNYQDRERTIKALKHFKRYEELGGRDPKIRQVAETLRKLFKQR